MISFVLYMLLHLTIGQVSIEVQYVTGVLLQRKGYAEMLTEHLNKRVSPFRPNLWGVYISAFGLIRVDNDVYGYEVHLGIGHTELLDCVPQAYGLDKRTGLELYNAILSCVPTATAYSIKQRRLNGLPPE